MQELVSCVSEFCYFMFEQHVNAQALFLRFDLCCRNSHFVALQSMSYDCDVLKVEMGIDDLQF